MKKIVLAFIMISLLASCYDPFRIDYPYTTVAFTSVKGNATTDGVLGRTIVKNEGLKVDIGVYLSGVLENTKERSVTYQIDPTILSNPAYSMYELLPANRYTLSNPTTFVIPSGSYIGRVTVTLDSVWFVNQPKALQKIYAIPFRLVEANGIDSILSTQSTKVFQISYINHYEGNYDQTATYQTFDGATVINSGTATNVINMKTISLDSTLVDGMIYIGASYVVKYAVRPDNTVYMMKMPVPPVVPINLASSANTPTADFMQGGRSMDAIRNGVDPTSSADMTSNSWGSWNSTNIERWVEYSWNSPVLLNKSEIYWWKDGTNPAAGMQPPPTQRYMYWNLTTLTWEQVTGAVGYGFLANQYNVTTFDQVLTTKIRIYMLNPTASPGILEWKIWGNQAAVKPEQAKISTVVPEGVCVFDQATSTYNLNYRINYESETYHTIVNTKLVWRNRIRDGVNEWRR